MRIKTFSALANGSASGATSRSVRLIADEWETGPNVIDPANPYTDEKNLPPPGKEAFKFNVINVSHLPVKIDGHCEHLFVAILNGEAVGRVIALKQPWGACGLRMLFVTPKHRHKGIGSRLVSRVQVFAHNEGCNAVEIAVHKGNAEARQFWIRRRFIDLEAERQLGKDCIFMERTI